MSESIRALLAGIVDYAGLFPPAALSLEDAVSNQRRYRNEPEAWMLGRFVCPVARLTDLTMLKWRPRDGAIAALVPGGKTEQDFFHHLDEALATIDAVPHANLVDTFEMLWPTDLVADGNTPGFGEFLGRVADRIPKRRAEPRFLFFEFAVSDTSLPDGLFQARLTAALAALAAFNRTARDRHCWAGFKFRTGGTTAPAIPSASRLAMVIAACRDAGVFWKATGGLHRPWRHFDKDHGISSHGFLNVLAATTLAMTEIGAALETILNDDEPSHFHVGGATFTWREYEMTATQVSNARTTSFRSFGSCSFEEPRQHLQAEGWL